jgi:integrase
MEDAIEDRRARRGIGKPLSEATLAYHAELLATAKRILPDRKLSSFTKAGLIKAITTAKTRKQKGKPARSFGQSRQKALAELVRQCYRRAQEKGQASFNPLAELELTQPEPKNRRLPTRDELDSICAKVEELFPRYGRSASLTIRLLAFSGMRLGEARGLSWDRIDGECIHITEQEGGRPLKTKRSNRKIPLNAPLREAVEAIAATFGRGDSPMPVRCVRNQLRKACEALSTQVLTNHDLRSWYATWLIQSKVDIATTSKWLGDDPEVVLRRYASVTGEHEKQEAGKLR